MSEGKTLRETIEEVLEEACNYLELFDGESDRGAAVLAVALFDDRLQKTIEKRFVNYDNKVRKDVFSRPGAPLKPFANKIELAYVLGLYGRKIRDGLHAVREIRNEFAHSPEPMGFDHEKVVARCRKLDADIQDPDNLRERYLTYLREVELSLRHSYVRGLPVPVERRDDPVECPNCGGGEYDQAKLPVATDARRAEERRERDW